MKSDWGESNEEAADKSVTAPSTRGVHGSPKKGKKASLPEVLDQGLDVDSEEVALLIEQGLELKNEAAKFSELHKDVAEKLGEIAASNGLEGLRHNDIVFTQRLQDGKKSTDIEKFIQGLLSRGVMVDVITAAMKEAAKVGDSYWVRSISRL